MALAATKRIVYQGTTYLPGEVLAPDPGPELARMLVEHNYCHHVDAAAQRRQGTGTGQRSKADVVPVDEPREE